MLQRPMTFLQSYLIKIELELVGPHVHSKLILNLFQ